MSSGDSLETVTIHFPQRREITGKPPFTWKYRHGFYEQNRDYDDSRVLVWMLSTGVVLPEVSFKDKPVYPFYWDSPESPSWTLRYELLVANFSNRNHGEMQKKWGTQPLNTFLRGHFCLKPVNSDLRTGWARANEVGEHVLIQQYFKSGWWGNGDRIIIKEQLQQNLIGIPLLRQIGILNPDTQVVFWDQSKNEKELPFGDDPFKLFLARDLPETYHRWLPEYLRHYRANDFEFPIEEVIERYVK